MYSGQLPDAGLFPVKTDFSRPVYCLMGLPVDALTEAEAVQRVAQAAQRPERCFFSTPNLNFLIGSRADAGFRDSVLRSDLSVADGMPLVWVARVLGLPVRERVAGSSMFEALRHGQPAPSVYFFGGPPGVAERAAQVLNAAPSGARCVGFHSPGFGSVEQMSAPEVIAAINASGAQLLVVALGAKKGQQWIEHNLARLRVPTVSHLGAVVNFVAGTVHRAPGPMGRFGLEWVWRIKEEPALWRRYWNDGLAFLALLGRGVLPALIARARAPSAAALAAARADCALHGDSLTLTLGGALHGAAQAPLRAACSTAAATPRDVLLDLTPLQSLDQAALGLLLLLYGHQSKLGRGWRVQGASARVQRQLRHNGAGYLLQAPAPAQPLASPQAA
jgi:N-acetylglucosaminyldiphosphoundecaprenol N-acetyl-beta-D-mannosaminyltransferase